MASNNEFYEVGNRGAWQGFTTLFRKENYLWWHTSRWIIQILIWLVIANGILFSVIVIAPNMEKSSAANAAAADSPKAPSTEQAGKDQASMDIYGLSVFLKMAGITIAIGVVILGQGTMIDERQSGTAAWVISKPISRMAFVTSKIVSHAVGILVTMAVAQGCIAYLMIYFVTGKTLPILPYIGAIGMLFMVLLFWLTLTILLSALSNMRGFVIGVPLIFILGYTLFVELLPWLGNYMPWNLTTEIGPGRQALAVSLVTGQPFSTLTPLWTCLVWCLLFTIVTIWRFQKEDL
jgi:ABC-2 type transport system permease protein